MRAGCYATIKSPADTAPEPLALVEFRRCASVKLGAPNDEVFSGHPLDGRDTRDELTHRRLVTPARREAIAS